MVATADSADERLYVGLASGVLEVYLYSAPSRPQLLATHPLARRQLDQLAVLPVLNYLAVLAGESVRAQRYHILPPPP